MKRIWIWGTVVAAAKIVSAHEGEPVETHSSLDIFFDTLATFFTEHGIIVFGLLFAIATLILVYWLWRRKQ